MQDSSRIKCPYYVAMSGQDKKMATITCETIEDRLGFEVKNQLLFTCHSEKRDYCQLFCEERYHACPYYKGIYKYQNEGRKRHEEKKKPD